MGRGILFLVIWVPCLASAAIYGRDDRLDVSQISSAWVTRASAIAVSLPQFYWLEIDPHFLQHEEYNDRTYGTKANLCPGERFFGQPSFGHCTAFLIHPKVVLTAGHCLMPTGEILNEKNHYCDNFSFWFDYNDRNAKPLGSRVPKNKVFRCHKVIYAINNESIDPEKEPLDFALLELTEPVVDFAPLKLADRSSRAGQRVSTMGHPHGLPLKFSGVSPVLENHPTVNIVPLDTLSGNSGGPVFNSLGEVEGLLISGHQYDDYETKKGCYRINRCDNQGGQCQRPSHLPAHNLYLKVEIWRPYLDNYLRSEKSALLF